jgi:DNA-binding transcriptional LysR family regulator
MEKLRRLEMVVRAADAGSFSRAARTLGVTPSGVSHVVADLEKEFRVSVFYRTTRQLRLTQVPHARKSGDRVETHGDSHAAFT